MTHATHDVFNQVPVLADVNAYTADAALMDGVQRLTGTRYNTALEGYGQQLADASVRQWADQANRHAPQLHSWDANGLRQDVVEFHPAWHQLMAMAFERGLHCSAWADQPGAHVGRAAHFLLHGQVESGSLCPLTMTSAAIPLLRGDPRFSGFFGKMHSLQYDASDQPWYAKTAVMVGMGLTEKQGGSDLRDTRTVARRSEDGPDISFGDSASQPYRLTGHKWFYSSPTSDAHLVLARYRNELSCFFVPRWLDNGTRNRIYLQRLKDKVGNRSNASAEVEFSDAVGVMVGEPGRGIATLIQMASYTRLDCVLGSAALLRQATVQAAHHANHRQAFGKTLLQQPLMRSVMVDLAIESEAATVLALQLAAAFDAQDDLALAWRRVMTPAAKFWVCKRAVQVVAECMEVWGGNGYIEDAPLARLYRETPVNSIWEGSGNIMCLDVLRAFSREPELANTLMKDLERGCATDRVLLSRLSSLKECWQQKAEIQQANARGIAGSLVLLSQAVLLRRNAPQFVADAFVASRFQGGQGVVGMMAAGSDQDAILERAFGRL